MRVTWTDGSILGVKTVPAGASEDDLDSWAYAGWTLRMIKSIRVKVSERYIFDIRL